MFSPGRLHKPRSSLLLTFGVGVVAGLIAFLSAGCLRPQQSTKVILRFASAEPNQEQQAVAISIVREFEKLHPDIQVETEFGITPRKILVQIAGGVGPDLFLWWFDYEPLIKGNAILDLAPLAKETGFDWGVFYPYVVDYYRRGEAIYGMPMQLKTYCLIYNRAIFDAAKEPYPDASWTWEKYLEVAERLTIRPKRGQGSAPQFGNGPFAQFFDYIVKANGGDLLRQENGKFQPDTPENRRALRMVVALLDKASPLPEDNASFGGGSFSQAFLTGKVAMQIAPAWMMAVFKDSPISWAVAPPPSLPDGTRIGIFDEASLVMNAHTTHPREAFEFLEFYASRQAMESFAAQRNGLAARRDSNGPFLDPSRPGMENYLKAAEETNLPIKPIFSDGNASYYRSILNFEFDRLHTLREISEDEFFRILAQRLNAPKPDIG